MVVGGAAEECSEGPVAAEAYFGDSAASISGTERPGIPASRPTAQNGISGRTVPETAKPTLAFQRGPIKRPERALQKLVRR
jgi:hypothetical protein